ncbi:hypothetical protein [Microbacterium dextranolyticum]|uniref:4Fe-4S Wbl-type domain-containing protein n=1 Tax=Microbacterium dextranolyticum TaxID=36806 RepID=A0A9W6HM10_9MICO|nr:hypothetical protein [Microbacterium dextranolyticum]MBM7463219.1 hypothetical protein [Microbacterium dextranolyticum]GLJ95676.1 hypothetical protein GCM10017591_17390 [Microbacterium dextranolyticum]
MRGLAAGTSVPATASALEGSPANSWAVTLLPGPTGTASSPEDKRDPREGHSEPPTTAQTDKLVAEALARHTQSFQAGEAFDDLNHALLLARERREEVPCVGPGAEAWTSEDYTDQDIAADLCLLCPVFALCQRYADAAQPGAGTWAGVTRGVSPMERRRHAIAEAREQRRARPRKPSDRPSRVGRSKNPGARDCTCRCGGTTRGGFYLPGHDSQHLSVLVASVQAGQLTEDEALAEVAHSAPLTAKLAVRIGS